MQLKYRGITYEYNPPITPSNTLSASLPYTEQRIRLLFLLREQSQEKRKQSLLMRLVQEIN